MNLKQILFFGVLSASISHCGYNAKMIEGPLRVLFANSSVTFDNVAFEFEEKEGRTDFYFARLNKKGDIIEGAIDEKCDGIPEGYSLNIGGWMPVGNLGASVIYQSVVRQVADYNKTLHDELLAHDCWYK